MSEKEIKDRAVAHIKQVVGRHTGFKLANKSVEDILAAGELAIVDREAKPSEMHPHTPYPESLGYKQCQQDMLKAGYVKEMRK